MNFQVHHRSGNLALTAGDDQQEIPLLESDYRMRGLRQCSCKEIYRLRESKIEVCGSGVDVDEMQSDLHWRCTHVRVSYSLRWVPCTFVMPLLTAFSSKHVGHKLIESTTRCSPPHAYSSEARFLCVAADINFSCTN